MQATQHIFVPLREKCHQVWEIGIGVDDDWGYKYHEGFGYEKRRRIHNRYELEGTN